MQEVKRIACDRARESRIVPMNLACGATVRFSFLALLLVPAMAQAQRNLPPGANPPRIGQDLASPAVARARIDSLAAADRFSGTVLVSHGDQVLLRMGAGLANRVTASRMTTETMLNIGSITKAFTQVAILRLVQDGTLRLDDSIGRYVDGFPDPAARAITIRQLLRHKGGMGDFFPSPMFTADPGRVRTLDDYMHIVRATPLEFAPGTRQRYSNLGYITLGAVLEKASGLAWHDAIRRYVYQPAGMTSSDVLAGDARGIAIGYAGAPPDLEINTATLPGLGSPAGGTYSTVDDLRRFALAIGEGKLLDPTHTALWFNEFEEGVTGMGPVGIAGGAPGVNAELEFNPVTREVVVVMANRSPPNAVGIVQDLVVALQSWIRAPSAP